MGQLFSRERSLGRLREQQQPSPRLPLVHIAIEDQLEGFYQPAVSNSFFQRLSEAAAGRYELRHVPVTRGECGQIVVERGDADEPDLLVVIALVLSPGRDGCQRATDGDVRDKLAHLLPYYKQSGGSEILLAVGTFGGSLEIDNWRTGSSGTFADVAGPFFVAGEYVGGSEECMQQICRVLGDRLPR